MTLKPPSRSTHRFFSLLLMRAALDARARMQSHARADPIRACGSAVLECAYSRTHTSMVAPASYINGDMTYGNDSFAAEVRPGCHVTVVHHAVEYSEYPR